MKIKRLKTNGFRGLPDRVFDLGEPTATQPPDVVYVTGPASSGKTSFLDAIIAAKENVAPYGPPLPQEDYVRAGESAAKVGVEWLLSEEERAQSGASSNLVLSESVFADGFVPGPPHDPALASILGAYTLHAELGKVEFFHAGRRITRGPNAAGIAAAAIPAIAKAQRLGKEDAKYAWIEAYLVHTALGLDEGDPNDQARPRKAAARVASAFESLCRTKRLDGVQRVAGAIVPRFVDGRGHACRIDQLSDAEKQALLFATTFVRCGVSGSIVLIDTPELHFAGPDVPALVAGLASLGTRNQLIVATASTEALAGVPSSHVIRLQGSRA